jgi:hypothetical protein
MKEFKRRTISLILASVISVTGVFSAENYKNSLMNLKFKKTQNGDLCLQVQTRSAYEGSLTPIKKDSSTYVLMLPEVDSKAQTPDIQNVSNAIESVNIKPMPYTSSGKGYTKITIKTYGNLTNLTGENKIYVPTENYKQEQLENKQAANYKYTEPINKSNLSQIDNVRNVQEKQVTERQGSENSTSQKKSIEQHTNYSENQVKAPSLNEQPSIKKVIEPEETPLTQNDNYESFLLVLGILFVLVGVVYLYIKAKNKMSDIAGNDTFDINKKDDNIEEKKNSAKIAKLKKIKSTIQKLDNIYSRNSYIQQTNEYTTSESSIKKGFEESEENIVDLDELYKKQINNDEVSDFNNKTEEVVEEIDSTTEEDDALAEFLNGFSFSDEDFEQEEKEQENLKEELYNKILLSKTIKFSDKDIECIDDLLNSEINNETLQNIEEFAKPKEIPSEEIKTNKQALLEDFVTSLCFSRNITFSHQDIECIKKIMNVELDNDFIENLKTNPHEIMEKEERLISEPEEKKPSDIVTLSVKDLLPNLSEELAKQGNKKIEFQVKPTVVYYNDGFDVNILSTNNYLPDLSKEINNKDAYKSKPSAEYEIVDNTYEVEKLNVADSSLPDLEEIMKEPDKYLQPDKKEVIVDEDALLNAITNVKFKPFYDGTELSEIEEDLYSNKNEELPSIGDIEKELNQFENFEISKEEVVEETSYTDDYDDFEELFKNEYIDLDQNEYSEQSETPKNITTAGQKLNNTQEPSIEHSTNNETKNQIRSEKHAERIVKQTTQTEKKEIKQTVKCLLDGETFDIIGTVQFSKEKGCHLAKNESGYQLLGYINDKLLKIKYFESLRKETLQARLSEKLSDKKSRYLVRIGNKKIILNVTDSSIEYVMDLC